MTSAEIRKRFLQFFAERDHAIVASSGLVPANDPTLFFTNAGMVQFKDVFTGVERRPYSRATTSQKVLRVSGKHNDLEAVGRTPRHHTFFEMLGNFSFGDYFKEDAIPFAWELLTRDLGIDPGRLWVTVHESDDEAAAIWAKKVGVRPDRIQRLGDKDNFWSMGDTGPCGPCSEIFYDHGPSVSSNEGGPASEDDRYVEIWNLVFMQYEQHADGSRTELPRPSIDTGSGLERVAAALQGKYWNYDTDLFQPLIGEVAKLGGVAYGADAGSTLAMRVIADHARAAAFLVADGITPSNEDRGYVLRRILRRAIRYGVNMGLKEPFLHRVSDRVVTTMGEAYPELLERRSFIDEIVLTEEGRFAETLERGLQLLEKEFDKIGADNSLPGDVVFKLYDTYGFPVDLTRLIAAERSVGVDEAGYHEAMEAQRAAGRAAWKGSGEARVSEVYYRLAELHGDTAFDGYERDDGAAIVAALIKDGEAVTQLVAGDEGELVTSTTVFYAESGGQVGDSGVIATDSGRFEVSDVQKGHGGVFLHKGKVVVGTLAVGDDAQLEVASVERDRTRLNHTATHLLHAALKQVLGDHVAQKGSLVGPDRLRFDFSHHKPVTADQITAIEDLVYSEVLRNTALETELMDLDDAKAAGAEALFGEKYDQQVRVVNVPGFSLELCGGTHARRTGDIGLFRIISESGVAAGVRRIEAQTGLGAMRWARARDDAAAAAAGRLRTPVEDLDGAIERLQQDRKRLEKELDGLKRELARAAAGDLADQARDIGGIKVLAAEVPGDAGTLRDEADRLRGQIGSGLVVLGSREGGKVLLIAAATKDVAGKQVHAGNIVRAVAKLVGGGGGGRPDMAQAGGRFPDKLPEALEQVYTLVSG